MQELIKQGALNLEDALMQLGVFTIVTMIKATALQLQVRVEFGRRGERIGGKGVFRERGEGLALFVCLHGLERHCGGGLALHGTLDINAADIA